MAEGELAQEKEGDPKRSPSHLWENVPEARAKAVSIEAKHSFPWCLLGTHQVCACVCVHSCMYVCVGGCVDVTSPDVWDGPVSSCQRSVLLHSASSAISTMTSFFRLSLNRDTFCECNGTAMIPREARGRGSLTPGCGLWRLFSGFPSPVLPQSGRSPSGREACPPKVGCTAPLIALGQGEGPGAAF